MYSISASVVFSHLSLLVPHESGLLSPISSRKSINNQLDILSFFCFVLFCFIFVSCKQPTREDRVGVAAGIFKKDGISANEVATIVDRYPGQSIDFFGALRSRVYDEEVRKFIGEVGVENLGKRLINSKDGPVKLPQPHIDLGRLIQFGDLLLAEQEVCCRSQVYL